VPEQCTEMTDRLEEQFRYDFLPTTKPHPGIRLVELLPNLTALGCLLCKLHQFRLDQTPAYETLLYVWGPVVN
jgi:hypothetical protein